MSTLVFTLLVGLVGQAKPEVEPAHRQNRIYVELLDATPKLGGENVALPAPVLRDGMSEEEQRAVIRKLAGSEQSQKELLRDSVTAPFILKIHDAPTADATLRKLDLWFVVRGDLAKLDPSQIAGQNSGKAVDVGNMRFESRILGPDELKQHGLTARSDRELSSWFVFVKSELLGRIAVEAVDEGMASRSADSLVLASRTSSAFNPAGSMANRWRSISKAGEMGPEQPYLGGISYSKISKLNDPAGALLVEVHSVFNEPRSWFQGEPILRSKFGLVAQDQIRRLRRELAANRSKTSP